MPHSPTSERELADVIRTAHADGDTLRIVGAGQWLGAGRPVDASVTLQTHQLSGIVEYIPGDLVLTARAGTSLAEIASATAPHNQWLALEPYGASSGTIGATIATGSSGPLSTGFGRARDLVLGLGAMTGDGQHLRVGGRVVKNVAGFDLVRLLTGSWGTLGVISEVSVRLHSLPQHDASVAVHLSPTVLQSTLDTLRALPLSPMAMQLLDATTATALLGKAQHGPALLVRLGGNAARVDAQRHTLLQLGTVELVDDRCWQMLRVLEDSTAYRDWSVFRVSHGVAAMGRVFQQLSDLSAKLSAGASVNAALSSGIVRVIAPATAATSMIAAMLANGTRVVGERLDSAAWELLPAPSDALSRGIRARFDPHGILNPGMFGNLVPAVTAR